MSERFEDATMFSFSFNSEYCNKLNKEVEDLKMKIGQGIIYFDIVHCLAVYFIRGFVAKIVSRSYFKVFCIDWRYIHWFCELSG